MKMSDAGQKRISERNYSILMRRRRVVSCRRFFSFSLPLSPSLFRSVDSRPCRRVILPITDLPLRSISPSRKKCASPRVASSAPVRHSRRTGKSRTRGAIRDFACICTRSNPGFCLYLHAVLYSYLSLISRETRSFLFEMRPPTRHIGRVAPTTTSIPSRYDATVFVAILSLMFL